MRPLKVEDHVLMKGLMEVLRNKGYEGASLNELARASGLKKASLYHRFPGGKKDIALAVLAQVDTWIEQYIWEVLTNESQKPNQRLDKALDNIALLYEQGEASCILRALSLGSGLGLFARELQAAILKWQQGFVKLGLDFGLEEKLAKELALDSLIAVQGSLVLSGALQSIQPFQQALAGIKKRYREE